MPLTDPTDAAPGLKNLSLGNDPDFHHEKGEEAHAQELPPVYEGKGTLTTDIISSEDMPTEEELHTLRRVADHIPWRVYTIAFVELCERFSYYGTTVVFTNFIQQPLDTPTGAATGPEGQAGALGMGQRASTGITTFNSFWVYFTPLIGAYVADTYTGRFMAIAISLAIAIVGHVIVVASAAPGVLAGPTGGTLAAFLIGLIIMGVGTGGFKPNISPLIAEQIPRGSMCVQTTKSGEKVIVDPAVTSARIYMYFYLFINIGALVGQIGMTYAEKYVGFWLAYLLPTIMLMLCPFVLFACKKMYNRTPPEGSVFGKSMRLFNLANKGRWSFNPIRTWKNFNDGTFWENVKPSKFTDATRPKWMEFDDAWVDEVGRGFAACSVFLWYPLYWLAYNQLNNNLTSQAAVMELHGIPNDVLSNLDPFALIILIPIFDLILYPGLRRAGIKFSPIKKITLGFFTGAMAMIWACVIQQYIYWDSACGYDASNTDDEKCLNSVHINVWAQTGSYVLIAVSEIFASITSLEYAFTKAPKNMRSLVMAFNLFMNAISSAIGEAFVSLSADPLLVWNYGVVAVLAFLGGCGFWIQYRQLDRDEDKLNMLPTGHLADTVQVEHLEEQRRLSVVAAEDADAKV